MPYPLGHWGLARAAFPPLRTLATLLQHRKGGSPIAAGQRLDTEVLCAKSLPLAQASVRIELTTPGLQDQCSNH